MTSVSLLTRQGAAPRGATPGAGPIASGRFAGVFNRLLLWQERASQRQALSSLDDRMLRDIGVTRAEAERESGKPFWRP